MSARSVQAVVDAGGEAVDEPDGARRAADGRARRRPRRRCSARHAGDTIAAGGKRLRPLLVCLAAGVPPPETDGLVRAAVAVELIHGATLVHDDVLDGSALRRGRPTVVAAGGRGSRPRPAICCSLARSPSWPAAARWTAVRVLSRASSELARGGAHAACRRVEARVSASSATSSAAG